jgi:hypothetical protein
MQDGIKLLIDRMDSYPEEFFGELSYRWSEIMQDIAKHGPEFLDEEDLLMLNKKVKEVRRKELNAKIVEEIATGARMQVAQERQAKTGTLSSGGMRLDSSGNLGIGSALIKPQGQKVWWSGVVPETNTISGYDPNSETFFGRSILDMIERGKDNAMLQNIRAQNAMLQEQLAETQAEIARRDEARKQSQAYKKRNNQNWK